MRYLLGVWVILAAGVLGGTIGWLAGVVMDRFRWLGLGPEEFWRTDPENVWAWGFAIGAVAGMTAAALASAWIRRKNRSR